MRASQATRTRRAAGAVEPSQELADLLALAGAQRAGRVLALLRELLLMPSPGGEQPEVMTLEQVAERLQVSPRTIRRAIDAGELAAVDLPFRGGDRLGPFGDRDRGLLGGWFRRGAHRSLNSRRPLRRAPIDTGAGAQAAFSDSHFSSASR